MTLNMVKKLWNPFQVYVVILILMTVFLGQAPFTLATTLASPLKLLPTPQYWKTLYNGYGKVSYSIINGINIAPTASQSLDETHAGLVLSKTPLPTYFRLNVEITNRQPLRQNDPSNHWEVFWLMFNYKGGVNQKTTNYLAFKPNGIELGAAYESIGQDYIYTADNPKMTWGKRYNITIIRDRINLNIAINKKVVAKVPLSVSSWLQEENGFIGLYTEDAAIQVHNIHLTTLP